MRRTDNVVLVDGDVEVVRAALRAEEKVKWDEETETISYDPSVIPPYLRKRNNYLKKKFKARTIWCLSDKNGDYFRKDIFPEYKGKRGEKPKLVPEARQFIEDNFKVYSKPKLEGDDILGILATHPTLINAKRKIIHSIDKDMETIPGLLFNPDLDKKPRLVTEEQAEWFHMYQTLCGDKVDCYPGCKGIGDVKAIALLEDTPREDWWKAIVEKYESKGFDEKFALVQAQLARICQWTDYDYEEKKVILWNPK